MKSMEERVAEIRDDPVKLKRAFTAIWVVAYGMLMLGAFLIIAVLLSAYL